MTKSLGVSVKNEFQDSKNSGLEKFSNNLQQLQN